MSVAGELLGEDGAFENTLRSYRDDLWHFHDGHWIRRPWKWLRHGILNILQDATYPKDIRQGGQIVPVLVDLEITPLKAQEIVECIEAQVTVTPDPLPVCLAAIAESPPHPSRTIAFNDVLLDCRTGKTYPRDWWWFDSAVLSVDYDPSAKCPTWERCVEEWSRGDPKWGVLLERAMGYSMMSHRNYEKWLIMKGLPRSGKGTVASVWRALMGHDAVLSTSLDTIATRFGLDGFQHARTIIIGEVQTLATADGARAARVIRNIVGRDPIDIEQKRVAIRRNVVCNAFIVLQANEVPTLPNHAANLSSKMLILPFRMSFVGHEDTALKYKLLAELPGIAARCAKQAMELEESKGEFPIPDGAAVDLEEYTTYNNPLDDFLKTYFVSSPSTVTSGSTIYEKYVEWCKANNHRPIARYRLPAELRQHTTWTLEPCRVASGESRYRRGIRGLALRDRPLID